MKSKFFFKSDVNFKILNQSKRSGISVYFTAIICAFFFQTTYLSSQTCTVNAGIPIQGCENDVTEWTLNGNSSDPSGSMVPITWSIVSQPAGSNVIIDDPNALNTDLSTLNVKGDYVFQITGICPDGSGTTTDQVTYSLVDPLPEPGFEDRTLLCSSSFRDTLCVDNLDPSLTYTWLTLDFPVGISFQELGGCLEIRSGLTYSGGEGRVILITSNGNCTKRDSFELSITTAIEANTGLDAVTCGTSFTKFPNFAPDESDEYQWVPYDAEQLWTQISGPNTATIIQPSSDYVNSFIGRVVFEDLIDGTYQFAISVNSGAPCFLSSIDTFTLRVSGEIPEECQSYTTNFRYIGDCEKEIDQWVIDLSDYGINPSQLHPNDSIIWEWQDPPQNIVCPDIPAPDLNQTLVFIPTDDICSRCVLTATYICHLSPSCPQIIEFSFFVLDLDCAGETEVICSIDGEPIAFDDFRKFCGGCQSSINGFVEVVNSSAFPTDTLMSYQNSFELPVGVHEFIFHQLITNHYDGTCVYSRPYNFEIVGIPTAANAGSDAFLPCMQTNVTLSGNDPDIPVITGARGTWFLVEGPNVPVFSDVNDPNMMVSQMVEGTYIFSWQVGNIDCNIKTDEVKIVVSQNSPEAIDLGGDIETCFGQNLKVCPNGNLLQGISQWSISPSNNINLIDGSDGCILINGLASQTDYELVYQITNGCGSISESILITTNDIQGNETNAGDDFCDEMTSLPSIVSYTLNGSSLNPGETGVWSVIEFYPPTLEITFDDINSPTSSVTLRSIGNIDYKTACLEWSTIDDVCGTTADIVCYDNRLSIDYLNDDEVQSCIEDDIVEAYYEGIFNGITWRGTYLWNFDDYVGPPGVEFLSDRNDRTLRFRVKQSGDYEFTLANGLSDCADVVKFKVFVGTSPEVPDVGGDIFLCQEFTTDISSTATGSGFWTIAPEKYINTNSFADIDDRFSTETSVTFNNPGKYLAIWTSYTDNPNVTECTQADTSYIYVLELADASNNNSYFCAPQNITLTGNDPSDFGNGDWTFISGPSTPNEFFNSLNGQISVYTEFIESGTYLFEYAIISDNCDISRDTLELTVDLPAPDAGPDMVVCADNVQLVGNVVTDNYSATWNIISGNANINGNINTNTLDLIDLFSGDTILIEYQWRNTFSCGASDTVQLVVDYFDMIQLMNFNPSECEATDGSISIANLLPNRNFEIYYQLNGNQTGPLSLMSDNSGLINIDNLGAGDYEELYLISENDCISMSFNATLDDGCLPPCELEAFISINSNINCSEGSDGNLVAMATGGTGEINFVWSTGEETAEITNLESGTYSVTVSDESQCVAEANFELIEPEALNCQIFIESEPSCADPNGGILIVEASGGTGLLTYLWSDLANNSSSTTVDNLVGGTYSVTVMDENECEVVCELDLAPPTGCCTIEVSCSVTTDLSCPGAEDGAIAVEVTGSQGMLSYAWSNGATGSSNDDIIAGVYSVTVSDDISDACIQVCEIELIDPDANLEGLVVDVFCEGGEIEINNEIYDTPGMYTQVTTGINGCDSIINIELNTIQPSAENLEFNICEGDSVSINDESYFDAGSFVQVLSGFNGCDSLLTINITLLPSYNILESYTIFSGDSILVNGISYNQEGNYIQSNTTTAGCDSTINITIVEIRNISFYGLDSCLAWAMTDNNLYTEFIAEYPEQLACASVESSILYRENPNQNIHSCTPGMNGTNALCIGSLDNCNYDPESDKVLIFETNIEVDSASIVNLYEFSFYQKAPETYDWINGNSGMNNYPTKFGIRVLEDGNPIYFDTLSTTLDWSLITIDLSSLQIESNTSLRFEMMGYCLIGNGSGVSAWDVEDLNLSASCQENISTRSLKGKVITRHGDQLQSVEVTATAPEQKHISETNGLGSFTFETISDQYDYTLEAYKNDDCLNGVSTLDLVMIQRHILGLDTFNHAYDFIAADINNNNSVSAIDVLELRKLILGIDESFQSNTSWRFHDDKSTMDLLSPHAIDEEIYITTDIMGDAHQFNAIKIGDISGNAIANDLSSGLVENRSNDDLYLEYKITPISGKQARIDFISKDFIDVLGFQFAIGLDDFEIKTINSEALSINNNNYKLTEEDLLISWNHNKTMTYEDGTVLFSLITELAQDHIEISVKTTRINSEIYHTEAYNVSDLKLSKLNNRSEINESTLKLTPNPFSNRLMLNLELKNTQVLNIKLIDLNGKTMVNTVLSLEKGSHSKYVEFADQIPSGAYILKIDSREFNHTEKVLKM